MIYGITLRYTNKNSKELFTVSKCFIDIFKKLNITLLPLYEGNINENLLSLCDGLILTGSPIHINPKLYNEKEKIKYNFSYNEDNLDYKLIEYFYKNNKKIIGICRGLQVLNVYFGGTLKQSIKHHENTKHYIKINENTFLSEIYKDKIITVNSSHTQSIKKLAKDFKICAVSSDNTIEAIFYKNIYGTQWHPEYMYDYKFFENIIKKEII